MAKDPDRIFTFGNFLAMLGIIALGVFTFIGHSFLSGGQLLWDIIFGVSVALGALIMLYFLVKAKRAENDLRRWRIVEWCLLGGYVVFAILTATIGGVYHFFVVNDQKEKMQQVAATDLDTLEARIGIYEQNAQSALARSKAGLTNYVMSGAEPDAALANFFNSIGATHTQGGVDTHIQRQSDRLIGPDFIGLKKAFCDTGGAKERLANSVNSWDWFSIHSVAAGIQGYADYHHGMLSQMAGSVKLPEVVSDRNTGNFIISTDNIPVYNDTEPYQTQLRRELMEAEGFSILGLVIILLINFVIILKYLVTPRAMSLGFSKKLEEDGGVVLRPRN